MASKHRSTIAKEIMDQTSSHFKKQQENLTATQPQMHAQEFEPKPSKKFEPTANFSKVFSETVGKKTRPSANINLNENPRLINASGKSTQQTKENETEHTTEMRTQEIEQKPSEKFEPTSNFFEVFSEIIGTKTRPSMNIKLKDNPRLKSLSDKRPTT